jgi:hypothetical protein
MTSVRLNTFQQIIACLFIFLFTYTALTKLLRFEAFIHVLGRSPLLGNINRIASWTIPVMKLGVSMFLLLPRTKKLGIYSAFILMSLFTLYVGYMLLFIPELPCSCGGVIQQLSWKEHLWLNIILTAFAAMAAFGDKFFVATNRGNRKPEIE